MCTLWSRISALTDKEDASHRHFSPDEAVVGCAPAPTPLLVSSPFAGLAATVTPRHEPSQTIAPDKLKKTKRKKEVQSVKQR